MQANAPELSDDGTDYRAVSTLAVIGSLLGVVSVASLFLPWLSAVPYVGLVVGYLAARSILAEPDLKTGLPIALVGVALSASALAGSWTRSAYASSQHRWAALPVAERFLGALASGEAEFACELMRPWAERVDPDRAVDFYREDADAARRLEELLGQPPVAALQRGAKLTEGPVVYAKRGEWVAVCVCSLPSSPNGVVVTLRRPAASRPTTPVAWRIAKVDWARDQS